MNRQAGEEEARMSEQGYTEAYREGKLLQNTSHSPRGNNLALEFNLVLGQVKLVYDVSVEV